MSQDGLLVIEAENGSLENEGSAGEGWFENDVLAGARGAYFGNPGSQKNISTIVWEPDYQIRAIK